MKKKSLFVLLTALVLVSCGGQTSNTSSPTSSGSSDTTSQTSETSTSSGTSSDISSGDTSSSAGDSSTSVTTTYNIVLPSDSRYTVTVQGNITKAAKGDSVTFTVTASDGYTISHVYVDSTEVTGSNGSYTITMPGHDIYITAELSVNGDVTLQGGVTAVLTLGDDGIYVAKDILVSSDTSFSYFVVGSDGGSTELESGMIDISKTLADVSPAYNSNYNLDIAGGSKYDFYYDPTSPVPCYIQRSEVVTLPSSANSLQSLFDGSIKSENTSTLQGVKHVTYSNSVMGIDYEWTKYNDNKALAKVTAKDGQTEDKYIYKELTGTTYKIVDTFDRGNYEVDAWNKPTYVYEDTSAFAGTYQIGAYDLARDRNTETSLYHVDYDIDYMSETMANYDLNRPDFDMESVDFDIDSAYRVEMTVADEVTYASLDISSVSNSDGGFTTTITSARVYDATAVSYNASAGITDKYYDEYAVTLTFDKKGQILSGSYLDTRWGENEYSLTSNVVTKIGSGTTYKSLSFTYEYGNPDDMLQPFDTSAYFVTSIDPVIKNSSLTNRDGNAVKVGDYLEEGRVVNDDIVELNSLPSTALDTWQYHVLTSSDEEVAAWDDTYRRFTIFGAGTTTMKVGSFVSDAISKDVEVTAYADYSIRQFWINGTTSDVDTGSTVLAYAYEKQSVTYGLGATAESQDPNYSASGSVIPPADLTFTLTNADGSPDTSGLKVIYNRNGVYNSSFTLDGSEVEIDEDVTLTLTLNTSMYANYTKNGETITDGPTTFTVYLYEMDNSASLDTLVDDWSYSDDSNTASMKLTKTNSGSNNYPYEGSITVNGTVYEFNYGFSIFTWEIFVDFDTAGVYGDFWYIDDSEGENIQVCIWSETDDMSSYSSTLTDILGETEYDEGFYTHYYANFVRA